jgi:type I restriction enzyme, S subunit
MTSEYLYHYLLYIRSHLEEIAPQSAQKNINLELLSPLPVPLLPESEQQRITRYLDQLEESMRPATCLQAHSDEELGVMLLSILETAFNGNL